MKPEQLKIAPLKREVGSLKAERDIGRKTYRTLDEVRADVFDYIERLYNRIRYLSPMEFEREAGLA